MEDRQPFLSVNYHLWEPCNMRCKFCYATFQDVKTTHTPNGHLPKDETLKVVDALIASRKFSKITFVGGEPTLCPWLPELILKAKEGGLTTMVVSNGYLIDQDWLAKLPSRPDWIAISIDSALNDTNINSGRAFRGKNPISSNEYIEKCMAIRSSGIRLKINTVVSTENYQEDMRALISQAMPERWKILQVLPVKGQNDDKVDPFIISEEQFRQFVDFHSELRHRGIQIIPESNDAISGSYLMIDPGGRFFDNTKGTHHYSSSILEAGIEKAINQISFSLDKFKGRGGIYNWS